MRHALISLALFVAASAAPAAAFQSPERLVISFSADDSELSSATVERLRAFVRANPDLPIKVDGHATLAEAENSEPYARGLSHRRAAAVAGVIVTEDQRLRPGHRPRNMMTRSFAAERGLEGVPANDARNQRVEVYSDGDNSDW